MIVAEFVVDHPILQEVLSQVPDSIVHWKETYAYPGGPTQMLVWITSDDPEAVQTAIEDDPSVRNPVSLADPGSRRLYRVDLTESGGETDLMSEVAEVGGVLEEAIGTNGSWWCRARFPDRAALQRIQRFCRGYGIEFTSRRLFGSTAEGAESTPMSSMLTDDQREALMLAWKRGYFDVPRRVMLVELAEELGVPSIVVSQRLRRAHSHVCARLFEEGDESHRPPLTGDASRARLDHH